MANLGIAKASYYADTSISRLNRDVVSSVEKVSKAKDQIAPGDKASLVSMDNSFKLDLAGKGAAIKSMSLTQAYLSTAISTLENASEILKEIHSLAVLGANGSNSTQDNELINMEAEALADAFHKSMTAAQFKGKEIFVDEVSSSVLSAGGRSNELSFGVGKVDYDLFYDYDNPPLEILGAGIKYQIRRELSAEEKETLMALVPDLSEAMIRPGLQFTTPEATNNIGVGEIDFVEQGEIVYYDRGQGNLQIDADASATVEGDFRGGSLDIAVTSNFEDADRLTVQSTNTNRGDIEIDDNGVISFTFDDPNDGVDELITVEIGEVDTEQDGTLGTLKINLYGDATTPGSGNLLNGDFESGTRTQYGPPQERYRTGFEHRLGMVDTFVTETVGDGLYQDSGDAFSTDLDRGTNTYSISFAGGSGTGFRAHLQVDGSGNVSIAEVVDKGTGYAENDILTIANDVRGNALGGSGFSIRVTSTVDSNDHDPGRNAANIHEVTEPRFRTVSVQVVNTVPTTESWGQVFAANTAKREISNDGSGQQTDIIHQTNGNYADAANQPFIHADVAAAGIATQVFTGVYQDDADITSPLIVDFDPTFSTGDNILEKVEVADYVANTGGNNNGTETAIYAINPADGQRITTTWNYADYTAGVADGSITSQGVDDTRQLSGVTNILAAAYDGGGPQYIDTPNYGGVDIIPDGLEQPGDNRIYNYESSDGVYAWGGGTYSDGDIVKDPAGSDVTIPIKHIENGTYAWNIDGTDFDPDDLNYNAGDDVLEYVAWANQFDANNPPAGTTVYRTDNELASPAFYTQSAGNVSYSLSTKHWERPVITDYDRQEITGYSRDEVAFYTRELRIETKEASAGTAEEWVEEVRQTTYDDGTPVRAHVGWDRDSQVFINNWTTYDGRVEFGSTFTITDTKNGSLIESDADLGTYVDNSVARAIPTPSLADMAQPDYGDFVRLDGLPGNDAIKNKDDAATVGVDQDADGDKRDYSDGSTPDVPVGLVDGDSVVDPFSGNVMELSTGELYFDDSAAFGIYHGPAVVSDQFRAEAGQFLRLNYTAMKDMDNYHVAGYIYQVDEITGDPVVDADGVKITMALSETGDIELNGRASVEIEEGGDYRFVFIVGTQDKTGGLQAGASMRIDNIVAEFPYSISEEAVSAILQSVNYSYDDTASIGTKTVTATLKNSEETHLLTDDAIINLEGFDKADQSDGPYMLAPTLNLVTTPSEGASGNASVLTSKIEEVQQRLNLARVQAGSQYAALEEAIDSTTDLRSQFALGSGTLSDLNFSLETAHLTRRQMQQDVATTMLAQANKTQSSLVSLIDGSYRTYLNAQFSHLK